MNPAVADPDRAAALLNAFEVYRAARLALLNVLDLPASNRDPFAEFSEHLVAALVGGSFPPSRVQANYDLILPDGAKIQVRSLANPGPTWVNEHLICRIADVEHYALVLFEAFEIIGVVNFPCQALAPVCQALGKRHPGQYETLQFTRRNWLTIQEDPARFERLGVRLWRPPFA